MKLSDVQIERLVRTVLTRLQDQKLLQLKTTEQAVYQRAMRAIREDFEREAELDIEVNRMLDDLERKNPGGFQRFKMFPMLKKRLAEQKGIIL